MAQKKAIDLGVAVGDVFLDKYRVEAILGHGGMGVVVRCIHLQLGERVAIKMLRPDVMSDVDAVERFQREAQAAARLKSEHVAKVSDVGTFGAKRVPYMVMEFLEGNDLDQLLQERGSLPVPWSIEMMLQAAEALAEAHSNNIIHRDVKPSNLFVTWRPDGTAIVKVLDFGISKSAAGSDMQLTQTQSLLGTPAYMSPEQMRSARMVDQRTDIWSLGCVMYEVIEGRRPFEADSFSEMCVKVAVDEPAPMVKTPLGLQAVITRCLAKTPEQRYASMAELGRDLITYAQDPQAAMILVERMQRMLRRSLGGDFDISTSGVVPLRDRSVPVVLQQPHDSRPVIAVPPPQTAVVKRSRKWPWAVGALFAIVVGVTIGKLAAGGSTEEPAKVEHQTMKVETPAPAPAPVVTPPPVVQKDPDVQIVEEKPAPAPVVAKKPKPAATVIKKPDPVVVTPPAPPPPVVKPKCDVWANPDGKCP